jgi:hypothetical protein
MIIPSIVKLTLTLFVARIGANDSHHSLAANDAAIFANATDGTANFHILLLLPWSKRASIKS